MGGRTRNSTPTAGNAGAKAAATAQTADPAATRARVAQLAQLLGEAWPDAHVELDHQNAYQLLVATILSAQSTDKMINTVTPALFAQYPDAASLAQADQPHVEKMVAKTGFFRMKAKHIIGMAQAVVTRHGGEVPATMDELVALPGVARKTANVVLGSALGINAGVVVDTHVTRLAARLGLSTHTEPVKIEHDLMAILPQDQWTSFAHRLIWHGRRVCIAKKPDCEHCTLAPLCPSAFAPVQPKDPSPRASWNKKQQAARKGTAIAVATAKAKAKPTPKAKAKLKAKSKKSIRASAP
ncbi:MAG: endonuclease III [Deltaproteobacteria bacterium]